MGPPVRLVVVAAFAVLLAPHPARAAVPPVSFRGQADTPSGARVVDLHVRCGTGPGGVLAVELVVPGALRPAAFDFGPFEGPDAPASRSPLTRIRVEGKGSKAGLETPVAGWYGGETPGAFVLAATRMTRDPGDLGELVRAASRAGAGARITWTQRAFQGSAAITATFALDAPRQRRLGELAAACLPARRPAAHVEVTLPVDEASRPLDGRLLLFVSTTPPGAGREPRFEVTDRDDTQQVFGLDVEDWRPGTARVLGAEANGYPLLRLADVPPGEYTVQALLHVYETFRRGDGHVVKLPPDRGEGQDLTRAPGNLLSAPRRVRIAPGETVRLSLDRVLPPVPPPVDTRYVKHVRIPNERLSRFWGRPVSLGAVVLLPEGWHDHPEQRYPLAIFHGHFQPTSGEIREAPPDPSLPPVNLEALRRECPNGHEGDACTRNGYERLVQETAHDFFRTWTSPGFPRAIVLVVQHANPYYDDSYAVNSENVGPYGDAITLDLVPEIERRYRGLGPWARALYGGSTGGWESLAAQVFYPDQYNGAWAACPDPVDFHHYVSIDLYADENAYRSSGPWRTTPRPASRDYLGQTRSTVEQENQKELALGTRTRSGGQWDAWEAVFSPVGADGYPRRIFDKRTGAVDRAVAESWRERFDLVHVLRRDWARIGPGLRGKIHVAVGLSDNFFLNDAVYRAEDFLSTAEPPADAEFTYGLRDEHCFNGDASTFNAVSRLNYTRRLLPRMVERWVRSAPPGTDVSGWRGTPGKF